MTWKSFAFNLQKGNLKFILNSTLDTLPTQDNLLQWRKSISDKCGLCNGRETTVHVLSACPVSLNQGRLTWRHDNIINFVACSIDKSKFEVFADIPEYRTTIGGTIPEDILVQNLKTDIVIVDRRKKELYTFELTVPFEHNISSRHQFKMNFYTHFESDITQR